LVAVATNDGNSTNTNETSAPAGELARKKSKTLLFIVLGLVLAVGGAGWYFLGRKTVAAKNEAPTPVTILHLDNFIVNLADTDRDAYLRVGIDLGVAGLPKPKSAEDKTPEPIPEIRDAILGVLSTYHSNDLLTPAGKKQLKENLIAAINRRAPAIEVRDIYFTDFLVQR
jgi:flagellar FliL protein